MDNRLVLEWFRFADTDLDTAEILLEHRPQHYEIICYHCQQSAEKYLKGYLVFNGNIDFPKTHDLTLLYKLCAEHNSLFFDIADVCDRLKIYGVQPRYPDEMLIEEHHVKQALEYARQIRDFEPIQGVRNTNIQ